MIEIGTCPRCGRDLKEHEKGTRLDPYILEIEEEEEWIVLCDECYKERALDV